MLAIYQANPQAFRQNMNVLRSGAVLRIPEPSEAAAVSPAEATAEIRRQYAAWRGAAPAAAATAATEKPGRLKLVTPSETAPAAANVTPPGPAATPGAKGAGNAAAQAAAASESKRLLELKNQELARMQAEAAAEQAARLPLRHPRPHLRLRPRLRRPCSPRRRPARRPPRHRRSKRLPAPPPAKAPPPRVKPAAAPSGRSFLDTLMSLWWVLALVALGLIAFFGMRQLKSRRSSEFDDSLGRLAAAGAETADLGSISARDTSPSPHRRRHRARSRYAPVRPRRFRKRLSWSRRPARTSDRVRR